MTKPDIKPSSKPAYFTKPHALLAAGTLAAALLAGCGTPPAPVAPPAKKRRAPARIAQPAVGWVGTYSGTVPCPAAANCTEQQLTLTLQPNNSYQLDTTVLRRGQPYTISSTGRLQWDETGRIITLASKDENARLLIHNNTAQRLPGSTDIDIDPAAYKGYVLRKQ